MSQNVYSCIDDDSGREQASNEGEPDKDVHSSVNQFSSSW